MNDDSDDKDLTGDETDEESAAAAPSADPAAAKPKRKTKKRAAARRARAESGALERKAAAGSKPARAQAPAPPSAGPKKSGAAGQAALFAAIALVAGAALGWFLRDLRSATDVSASADPATIASAAGSAGPCGAWSQTICEQAGAESEACGQARAAADLLPVNACNQALADVPATMEKLKTARSSCDDLVKKLCADLGAETSTCKMVQEKTPQMPPSRCKSMLDNYQQVIGELRQMERQNAPIPAAEAEKQRAGDGPAFGPADAKVAIVEYSDFECPYCSKAADTVNKLKKRYGSTVRFVFRQYPLPMHPNAPLAAEASLAAHAQGKFWPYHDLLFANQRQLDRESLESYAKQVGLDMTKFKKALDEHTYADQVKADMKLGQGLGVSGTPTMIVGTERVPNPTDFAAVSKLIDAQLEKAGVPVPAAEKN